MDTSDGMGVCYCFSYQNRVSLIIFSVRVVKTHKFNIIHQSFSLSLRLIDSPLSISIIIILSTSHDSDAASETTADGEEVQTSSGLPEKNVCTEHISPASETVPVTMASAPDAFEATVLPATPQRMAGNALDSSQASPLKTCLPEANHSNVASVMPQNTLEENRQLRQAGQATVGTTDIVEEPVHVTRTSARRRGKQLNIIFDMSFHFVFCHRSIFLRGYFLFCVIVVFCPLSIRT